MSYVNNLEREALENENFRKVLNTTEKSQLVVMSLLPYEDIGEETHDVDQFIRVEKGKGKVVLNGKEMQMEDGFAVVIPAGALHNITNTENQPLKLYTIYTPPQHPNGTVHKTKVEAEAAEHS